MKKAFTLIEVNLAILIMATGVLSIVVLYSLGFREARQCNEDIESAAYADAVLGPLVGALSSTKLAWSDFNNIENLPENGWGDFIDTKTGTVKSGVADGFGLSGITVPWPDRPSDCKWGLVISHEQDSGLIRIGFRSAKRLDGLLTAPLYYTEVHFQGKQDSE